MKKRMFVTLPLRAAKRKVNPTPAKKAPDQTMAMSQAFGTTDVKPK